MARIARRIAGIGASDLPDAAAFDAYVGPAREITVDQQRGIIALHDGVTPGGQQFHAGGGGDGDTAIDPIPKSFAGKVGTNQTYTLDLVPATAANVLVYVGGIRQAPSTDYTVSGATLTILDNPDGLEVDTLLLAGPYSLTFIQNGSVTEEKLAPGLLDGVQTAAIEAAEALIIPAKVIFFASRSAASLATIPAEITTITTVGYSTPADGGGAEWVEVDNSGPLKSYQVQSNGGSRRWQMIGDVWNIRQFGAVADGRVGNTDNAAAIQAAVNATIETRRGELFAPGGSYGIGSTITVNLTDTTIAGRGVTCNIVGAGSDATEFFWLANNNNSMFSIVGPATTSNLNLGGVQNLHWRGFSGHMLFQGKGTFISTTFCGHSKFEDIHSFEFDCHWQMVDALVVMMDRVRASNGRRGFWAYRGSFTYPNAFTFVACTFGGMNEWGIAGEGISGWTFIGGSIEGNGASVAHSTRGGLLLTAPGPEGGLGLTVEGTYFEYNGGTADILITANPNFPSSHKIAGVFNRGSTPANAVHNIYVQTDAGYAPVNIDYTGSAFVSFPGYTPSGSTVRMTTAGAGPVRFHGSAYFKDAIEGPANADSAPIAEAQFNIAGTPVVSRSSNVTSVVKNAVGDYTINLAQPKRGNAYVECMTDGVVIVSKFAESATMVRLRLFSVGAVLTDPPSSIAVRVFA